MDDSARPRLVWWRWIGWLVSLTALGFIGRWLLNVDRQVWSTLADVRIGWLAASLVIFQLWFLLRYWAWEYIIRRHGYEHGRGQNMRMWIISEIYRYIPGNIWSFAGRFRGATSGGVDKKSTVHALMLEAGGLLAGASIVTLAILGEPWVWLSPVATLVVVVFGPWIIRKGISLIRHETITLTMTESAVLLGLYVIIWVIFGFAHVALFQALQPTIGSTGTGLAIGVSVFSWFIGYVTIITPMGLGVREAVLTKSLTAATTISVGTAGLVAIISRVWMVISELVFFVFVLIGSSRRPRG